jgi:capsular polysaccharide transport system permease protein
MSTNSPLADQASVSPVQTPAVAASPSQSIQTKVQPLAKPAHMKRRHWGMMASFFLLVLAPVVAVGFYLFVIAEDQYSSTVGFTVRQEEAGSASELLGGLASFAGGSTGSDRDILYEFIQSQGIVEQVDAKLDLTNYYAQNWKVDPVFSLWPDATTEDLLWFWQRVVRISYDQSTGLIEVQVLAFDPEMAQNIAKAIVDESQAMINALNTASRDDAMRYAQADLASAVERLKSARKALTRFRTRTQIVDPEADIQGRMGVVNNLQQQLAQALIDLDLLQETTNSTDPRVPRAEQRISVIRNRIDKERANFANSNDGPDAEGNDYPALIAEFESLSVDREFGEVSYRAALAALDLARANASRQSTYLAAYIQPTRAQSANFPQRGMLLGLTIMLCLLSWAILALIYYSIRDRR